MLIFMIAVLATQLAQEPIHWHNPRAVGTRINFRPGDCFWWNSTGNRDRKTDFLVRNNGQELEVSTHKSKLCVGILLPTEPRSKRRQATWEWMIADAPSGAGSSTHQDQAVQIYFISNIQDKETGFYLTAGATWTSSKLPHDSERRKYTEFTPAIPETALFLKVRVTELASEAALQGDWRTQEVDLKDLFLELFPSQRADIETFDSSTIIAVAIFADSDHTASTSRAVVRRLALQ